MKLKLFLIVLVALLGVSTNGYTEPFLNGYDLEIEKISNEGGAPISYWDSEENLIPSYSEWRCFSTYASTVACSTHEMEELVKTPMIAVYFGKETLEIETSPADNIDCESTIEEWRELLEGEEVVCTLASFIQDLPHENYGGTNRRTLWIIEALKTSKGYWMTPGFHKTIGERGF